MFNESEMRRSQLLLMKEKTKKRRDRALDEAVIHSKHISANTFMLGKKFMDVNVSELETACNEMNRNLREAQKAEQELADILKELGEVE